VGANSSAAALPAATEHKVTGHKVMVCIEQAPEARYLPRAELVASKMFVPVGIRLDWRHLHSCPERDAIQIGLSFRTAAGEHPGALAYAAPYQSAESVRVVVFYDRVSRSGGSGLADIVLAHVLVHEITHILENMARHAETGVMKARWDAADYRQMARSPLPFAEDDVALIRRFSRPEPEDISNDR
jgi:hypothetical protein